MKKKLLNIAILIIIVLFLLTPLVAIAASDISGALWYGVVVIANNSTVTTNVATIAGNTINTTSLINGGFLNANADDCAMRNTSGADVTFQPGYTPGGYPWCVFVPSIGANSYLSNILYTANSTGGEFRYFPGPSGMTTSDSASLELGDNFTYEAKGWFDTTTPGSIVIKDGAVEVATNGSGNITAFIADEVFPSAAGTYTQVAGSTGGAHWTIVSDESDATNIFTSNAVYEIDTYNIPNGQLVAGQEVTVYLRLRSNVVPAADNVQVGIRTLAADYFQPVAGITTTLNWAWYSYTWENNPNTGNPWTDAQLDALEIGLRMREPDGVGGSNSYCSQVYAVATRGGINVSAGVSSGEHTVNVTGSPAFLGLGIDIGNDTGFPLVSDNVVLNAPLWSPTLTGSPFESVDAFAHTCTVTGAVWGADGRIFDGVNDKIDVTYDAAFQADNGTVMFWLRPDALTGAEIYYFIARGATNDATHNFYIRYVMSSVDFDVVANGQANNMASIGSLTTGTWTHLALVWAQSGNINLYKDSVKDTDGNTLTAASVVTNASILIGSERRDTHGDFTEGIFGDVIFYNRALSSTEVSQHYNDTQWKYIGANTDDDFDYVYSGTSVPNNANDWVSFTDNCTLYAEYQRIWVDGVQQQDVEWEYDTTFTDLSGNSHPATPSFRTLSSDPDVSANMTAFLPIAEAIAPDYILGAAPPFIDATGLTGNITAPFTVVPPTTGFPLAGVIAAVAAATSTPAQLPLLIIALIVILATSLTVSALIRQKGSGSIVIKIIAITAVMGVFIALRNFGIDFWMLGVFLVISIALAMGSRQLGWT